VTFTVEGLEAHGVSRMLSNRHNFYVRSGFHCAQPAHEILKAPPTVRASFYRYNEASEIEQLAEALGDFVAGVAADPQGTRLRSSKIQRSGPECARISCARSSGASQAAKSPPLSTSLK
jgi:hypothetical protein